MAAAYKTADLPVAEVVRDVTNSELAPIAIPLRVHWTLASLIEWLFGFSSLLLALSILSTIPLLQFLTLGYLLEVSGRVAKSGRLRDGFIGVRTAARLGGIALGSFLLWLPLYGISYLADRARIIDSSGTIAHLWESWLVVLTTLFVLHVIAACLKGGRLRSFFWPFNIIWLLRLSLRRNVFALARDSLWKTVTALRLPYYFWLGFRGFFGAFLYLVIPLILLGQSQGLPVLKILGGVLLGLVVLDLPFLQTRFARDGRFRAFFQLCAIRRDFRYAPVAFSLALSVHLLFAMPLYVLKIEMIPGDLLYLEGLIFLAFIFPTRLLDGWAYSRPTRGQHPRFWVVRWTSRLSVLPVILAYVLIVFASQYIGWNGVSGLYEQHAFLIPVPFASRL